MAFPLLGMLTHSVQAGELATAVSPYEAPRFLRGAIYRLDRKTKLFQFTRNSKTAGKEVQAIRNFDYLDGKLAARETVTYHGSQFRAFELEDFQTGARGSARLVLNQGEVQPVLRFEYSERTGAKPKTAEERLRPDTLVTDMIPGFLVAHWDRLMRGDDLKCRLMVVPRRETVGFTFHKSSEKTEPDKVIIKMSASSALIAALVDPVFFVIEKDAPHHILEYSGRTTPRIRTGNSWKDLEAVTVFDWKR
jgi:hypothetical protein